MGYDAPMTSEAAYPAYLQAHLQGLHQVLEPYTPWLCGNALGSLLVVKGIPGPAEQQGGPAFSGEDGAALEKAFQALGYGEDAWLGVHLDPPGREALDAGALSRIASAMTPRALIACDKEAAALCKAAHLDGFQGPRVYVELEGFEASLADDAAKKREWAALKAALQLN